MKIEAKALTKLFKAGDAELRAVDNANLSIDHGEFVTIVGHSGSGKSTLLSLLGGLTRPSSGNVLVDGTDLQSISDNVLSSLRNSSISFIYQFSSLISTLDAMDNVLLPTAFGKFPFPETSEYATTLLKTLGLGDKLTSFPSELSGGQQRRVAIARAFINSPKLILADEPTGDLDEETEAEVIGFFKKMNADKGITFILVTHSSEIAKYSDRQFRMIQGRLEES